MSSDAGDSRLHFRNTRWSNILLECNGEMSVREVAERMGYKSPPSSLRRVIRVLIAFVAVEYTNSDSPNAPNQRIRLV